MFYALHQRTVYTFEIIKLALYACIQRKVGTLCNAIARKTSSTGIASEEAEEAENDEQKKASILRTHSHQDI